MIRIRQRDHVGHGFAAGGAKQQAFAVDARQHRPTHGEDLEACARSNVPGRSDDLERIERNPGIDGADDLGQALRFACTDSLYFAADDRSRCQKASRAAID